MNFSQSFSEDEDSTQNHRYFQYQQFCTEPSKGYTIVVLYPIIAPNKDIFVWKISCVISTAIYLQLWLNIDNHWLIKSFPFFVTSNHISLIWPWQNSPHEPSPMLGSQSLRFLGVSVSKSQKRAPVVISEMLRNHPEPFRMLLWTALCAAYRHVLHLITHGLLWTGFQNAREKSSTVTLLLSALVLLHYLGLLRSELKMSSRGFCITYLQ